MNHDSRLAIFGDGPTLKKILSLFNVTLTIIASDAFYGGHTDPDTTWFQRLWFKLTKAGSFRACRLPVYRTVRVKTDGCVKVSSLEDH